MTTAASIPRRWYSRACPACGGDLENLQDDDLLHCFLCAREYLAEPVQQPDGSVRLRLKDVAGSRANTQAKSLNNGGYRTHSGAVAKAAPDREFPDPMHRQANVAAVVIHSGARGLYHQKDLALRGVLA